MFHRILFCPSHPVSLCYFQPADSVRLSNAESHAAAQTREAMPSPSVDSLNFADLFSCRYQIPTYLQESQRVSFCYWLLHPSLQYCGPRTWLSGRPQRECDSALPYRLESISTAIPFTAEHPSFHILLLISFFSSFLSVFHSHLSFFVYIHRSPSALTKRKPPSHGPLLSNSLGMEAPELVRFLHIPRTSASAFRYLIITSYTWSNGRSAETDRRCTGEKQG